MGSLSKSFVLPRNALKGTVDSSASTAMDSITHVRAGIDLSDLKSNDNGAYNVYRDFISFTGIIERTGSSASVTHVGDSFERLYQQNPTDAWRWLLTRALWLYTVPNATDASVNRTATTLGVEFDFFRRFIGLLLMMSSLPGDGRFISYQEICRLFDDDSSWTLEPADLLARVIMNRASEPALHSSTRTMLEVEPTFGIPRDNFAGMFGKAFKQTGLFEYRPSQRSSSGIALHAQMDRVLQRRVRFILDNPQTGSSTQTPDLRDIDLPEEVSLQPSEPEPMPVAPPESLTDFVSAATSDFKEAGLMFSKELIARFSASLITKRFVVLTGLSGSGKTKLAQAFAVWLSPPFSQGKPPFAVGDKVAADRTEYTVTASDTVSVEVVNPEGTKVALPLALVEEWVSEIELAGLPRDTSPRTIREAVAAKSAYSSQLNSFETHLKALAYHRLAAQSVSHVRHYEVVSVGPDWTSRESSIGYVDALDHNKFVRSTPIIGLILKAVSTPDEPFFLILDEMNLSHVERYFADFLSAAESDEEIFVHGHSTPVDGVPGSIPWPNNLFVIGTVNVDETTYMFSPKVLDRANTIEFRMNDSDVEAYLSGITPGVSLENISGHGVRFSAAFMQAATGALPPVTDDRQLRAELALLFSVLHRHRAEFGFRTAKEMMRFFGAHAELQADLTTIYTALDAQVLQKVLPKLNGTRRSLEGLLSAIASYATAPRRWSASGDLENGPDIKEATERAGLLSDPSLHPLTATGNPASTSLLPLSYDKIERMLKRLDVEGFTSFAEA